MKKFVVSAVLLGAAASAQAADLPRKAPVYKAPVAQVYDWTGFYIGANAGVGFGRSATNVASVAGATNETARLGGLGALGGGQIGYNWQYGNLLGFGNVVLGVEADIQGAGFNDDRSCGGGGDCATFGFLNHQKLDWFGTVRGRVGLATGPVLSYFTGGFAYGNVKTTINDLNSATSTTFSDTRTGWTIGSGVEAALGGNWTGKIEYLYVDLGTQRGLGVAPSDYAFGSDIREHIFRVGVNYRIGGNSVYAATPTANWSGLYIGGNAGGATALNRSSLNNPTGIISEKFNLSPDGYIGGAQIGYNFQAGNLVYGVEADFQGSSLSDDKNCLLTCAGFGAVNFDQKLQWFGTVRGRAGYAIGSSLFYVTGGLAYGNVKTHVQESLLGGLASIDTTFDRTKTGYTVGGGVETPLDFLGLFGPNWTSKTEYLFVDLGRATDTYSIGVFDHSFSTKVQEHVFRTGLNYHFNSPVVAKY
jgi:outer membrane immunogenic protein